LFSDTFWLVCHWLSHIWHSPLASVELLLLLLLLPPPPSLLLLLLSFAAPSSARQCPAVSVASHSACALS
jgi:hypothetical protein